MCERERERGTGARQGASAPSHPCAPHTATTMWLKPRGLSAESYGLLLVLASAVLYALAGAYVKLAHSLGGLPSTQLVFCRGVFQGALILLGLYVCRDAKGARLIRHPFGRSAAARRLVWTRGLVGGAGFLLDYHCMAVLPLGDAMTLMSMYPFVTIVFAKVFLGEEVRPLAAAVTAASVGGAVLIAQPTFLFGPAVDGSIGATATAGASDPRLGYVTGLLGACCLATVLILIRKAGALGVHTFQLLLSWALFGVLFSILAGPYEGEWIWTAGLPTLSTPPIHPPPSSSSSSSWRIWCYIGGVCGVGAGAHFLLNYAGRLAPAGLVSVVRASDIVWAYCFEVMWFVQRPNGITWMGVALVVGSLVAIGMDKVREERPPAVRARRNKDRPPASSPRNGHPPLAMLMGGGTPTTASGRPSAVPIDEESQELLFVNGTLAKDRAGGKAQ